MPFRNARTPTPTETIPRGTLLGITITAGAPCTTRAFRSNLDSFDLDVVPQVNFGDFYSAIDASGRFVTEFVARYSGSGANVTQLRGFVGTSAFAAQIPIGAADRISLVVLTPERTGLLDTLLAPLGAGGGSRPSSPSSSSSSGGAGFFDAATAGAEAVQTVAKLPLYLAIAGVVGLIVWFAVGRPGMGGGG